MPALADTLLRRRVHQLHRVLERPGEELEAESRLALVADRLGGHLSGRDGVHVPLRPSAPARRLRDLLDSHFCEKFTLQEISESLHVNPAHLVRAFRQEFGITPHQYVIGRRVDLARKLLLQGMPPGAVAVTVGFYDQAHLGRHFRNLLGTSPMRFAHSNRGSPLLCPRGEER